MGEEKERETVEIGFSQTVKPSEGMLKSNDSSMKKFMRCAEECGLDLVSLGELCFKGAEAERDGSRDQLRGNELHKI